MASPQVENGYTRISNELYEAIMTVPLNGYDRRVLDAVIRKTYGYNKKEDFVSLSQISTLTNIKIPHVSRSLQKLKKLNIITNNGSTTKYGNKLGINKNYLSWTTTNNGSTTKSDTKVLPKVMSGTTKLGKKVLPNQALQKTIKDNNTKDNIQKTVTLSKKSYLKIDDIEENDLLEISEKYSVPLSFVRSELDDMVIWAQSRPNNPKLKGRNYRMTLMNFVKRDAIKIKSRKGGIADGRGII